MKTEIQVLQDEITPEVLGILWITDEVFCNRPRPFVALDYFFDGLLSSTCQMKGERKVHHDGNNFFVTKNFEKDLFLGHLHGSSEEIKKSAFELLELAKGAKSGQRKILLIDSHERLDIDLLKRNSAGILFKRIHFFD